MVGLVIGLFAVAIILLIAAWAEPEERKPLTKRELIDAMAGYPDDARIGFDYDHNLCSGEIVSVEGFDEQYGYITLIGA